MVAAATVVVVVVVVAATVVVASGSLCVSKYNKINSTTHILGNLLHKNKRWPLILRR